MRPVDVGVNGCVKLAAKDLLGRVKTMNPVCVENASERLANVKSTRAAWEKELDDMTSDNTLCVEVN